MIIYQPAVACPNQGDLHRIAVEAAKDLVPQAQLLSSKVDIDSAHLLLRTTTTLTAFEIYSKELGEETFEAVLKVGANLESRRREKNDFSLKDVSVYLLALGFSQDFLLRIPFGLVGICLFEWRLIRSKAGDAILIREPGLETGRAKEQAEARGDKRPNGVVSRHYFSEELSTPELIAFARLGMKLRSRGAQNARIS